MREECFRKYKNDPTIEKQLKFKQARYICNSHIRKTKFLHDRQIRQKIMSCPKGSKNFWSFVKNIKNSTTSSIPTLVFNDIPTVSSLDKANLLAAQFAANSTLPNSNLAPPELESVNFTMKHIFFRTRSVARVLKDLNIHKSAGPDGIPAIILKRCSSTLAKPLRKIFHLSHSTGLFPSSWKTAYVQPVPKKGESSSPSNYRPIALTSILSKVMETLINRQLMKYLEERKLLNDRQYGFRSKRSTGDLMAYLTEKWNQSLHFFGESKIIALDISKAFDRVWHQALISKMRAFGIDDCLLRWISNFLSNRSIQVVLDGYKSDTHYINAGVPQGSVLSPTLFLIFINDLLSKTTNPVNCFADDSTLSFSYSFPTSRPCSSDIERERLRMISSLNSDLDSIVKWGYENRVEFNASKTQCCLLSLKFNVPPLPLSMSGTCINETEKLSVLGMCVNDDLRWNDHIFQVAKNGAKCLGFLKRCRKFFTPSDLASIYKAYVRPKLEYNSHIWSGASQTSLRLLDRVQHRALKLIGDGAITESIDSLEHRRNVTCLSLFYRFFYNQCSSEVASCIPSLKNFNRNTRLARNAHKFYLEPNFGRTVKYRDSFFSRSTRMWNALPGSVFPPHYNLQRFKVNVHRCLLLNPLLFS